MQFVSGCLQINYVSECGGEKKHVIFVCIFDVLFVEGARASIEGATIYFHFFIENMNSFLHQNMGKS